MKRLTLMRHADARWQDAGLSDLERPLNRRGAAAAETMARRLLELALVPQLLLVSPARRTQQTGEIVAQVLSLPPRLVMSDEALYLASAADLLKAVQATGPRVAHLLVVAHNPGVSELVQQLIAEAEASGLATAALCSIEIECDHWSAVGIAPVKDVMRETPPPRRLFGLFS
ncbi:MAG TPA: histidine phosphatase family protein [Steroidobacteraceae bacterium]|nr:histidine phosphatase family protein [Steroidobacteraceae bacterium]